MKIETYLRSSLLSPYLLWFFTALILAFEDGRSPKAATGAVNETIITIAFYYTFGIIIWILPYSILAAILWFWSSNRPANRIAKVFSFSPPMMAVFVAIEILLFSFATSDGVSFSDFYFSVMVVGLFSIPFGYAIIVIVIVIYKLLKVTNFIKPENDSPTARSEST